MLLSNLFDVWDNHHNGGAGNGGHGVGGATKKKSLDDVVVNLSCVSTQITGTVGSAKTDPFSAQKPDFGNCLQKPRPLYYHPSSKRRVCASEKVAPMIKSAERNQKKRIVVVQITAETR